LRARQQNPASPARYSSADAAAMRRNPFRAGGIQNARIIMNTPSPKRAAMLLTVAAFLSIGCTSLQNVPLSRGAQGTTRPDIKAGESVVVTKNDGTKRKFTVLKVEDDALVGHNVRINYADMQSLEAQRADRAQARKAMIIGGAVLGAVAIAVAAGSSGGGGGGY
jgi:hypothetical protein